MSLVLDRVGVDERLHDVTLAFARGALTCVVGENGAGKSTLLDVAAGILPPARGAVALAGTPLAGMKPRDRATRIASLGQELVDIDLSVAERIAQGLAPRRGSGALLDEAAEARVRAVAEELGVAHLLGRDLPTLSSGERRRVDVARALVDDQSEAVVVDEPHAGVDVKHQALVSRALAARAKAGKIVVVSIHDLAVAATIADRIVGMRQGRVGIDGAPAEALTSSTIECLYDVRGAVIVREGDRVAVLLP